LDDISELSQFVSRGLEGAILGKALYAKRFTLEQALELVSR
jgi:phosphoribosylformimino-5-aminoimidazole carboxamide ribonucleotide (ProFAR) isomerase